MESQFDDEPGSKQKVVRQKSRLSFSDELGSNLAEVHTTDKTYYSRDSPHYREERPAACCIIA
jgi:hypothetical protein